MKTITFDSWRRVPKTFGTRRQWLRRGRQVPPKAEAAARLVFTYEPPGNGPFADEIWVDEPELCLLVNQEVPLFHASQTEAVELTPRTRAYLQFEKIFFFSPPRTLTSDGIGKNKTSDILANWATGRPCMGLTGAFSPNRSFGGTSISGRSLAFTRGHALAIWLSTMISTDGIAMSIWIRRKCSWNTFTAAGGIIKWP